jgi:hypothetical protein
VQRVNTYVHEQKLPSYNINLDPAVTRVPYGCNIDIRDTVNYKEVCICCDALLLTAAALPIDDA